MKYIRIISLCMALLSSFASFSQSYLILEKVNHTKSFRYTVGDLIKVKDARFHTIFEGCITSINDTSIAIGRGFINFKDIEKVYIKRQIMSLITSFLITGGIAYLSIDSFNGLLQCYKIFSTNVVVSSLSLIGAGAVLWSFKESRCKISPNKWKLKVIDFYKL